MGHSHWIGKDSLSDKEKAAAQAYTKEKGILPPSPDADAQANPTGDSAAAIYNRVKRGETNSTCSTSIHG